MSDTTTPPPFPRHGGDLTFATRTYGAPADGWLDLSTGINPNPYPAPPILPEALHRLPGRDALLALLDVARRVYRVPDGIDLIATPGTEAAIRLLALVAPPGKVAIVSPTYGTYSAVWPDAEHVASVSTDVAVAVIVNPNNPDGRVTPLRDLPRAPLLIVDEAFADCTPEASLIPSMRGMNAIVLRSLGKFYGLAGVRLGFIAAPRPIAARLSAYLGHWPVSGPAITIGTAALADDVWRDAMRGRLKIEAAALRMLLNTRGLTIVGGTDLFVLAETDDAHALHRALAQRRVWTRAFADQAHWLRVGLPGAANMARLGDTLSAVC